jgi:hypothetical protein
LTEKFVEVTVEVREIEGGEIDESMKESRKERESWITDCERESKSVGDGEKLFRDE